MEAMSHSEMVNGRVSQVAATKAARVLAGEGLTISAFIRNSIEHLARTGEVPQSGFPARGQAPGKERLRSFVRHVESLPMPGKHDYPGISEDGLVERLLMERHGY